MRIGIAAPVSIYSLKDHLVGLSDQQMRLGMGGTAVNQLINALLKQGHYVSVYSLDRTIAQPIFMEGPCLKVFMGVFRERARYRIMDFFYRESSQIKQFIIADQPDIVNAHWTYEYAIGTIRATQRHLLTFRDDAWEILRFQPDLYRFSRLLMDWWVRRKGKYFSVNSPYLQAALDIAAEKLPIIPNPISDSLVKKQGKNFPEGRKIKIVSLLNGWLKRKNPVPAVKAFNRLVMKNPVEVEYHIYGRDCGPEEAPSQWVRANKLDTQVFFHGEVEHAVLMSQLPEYDILLHPALEESFGNTLIEAMACGIPVVAGKDAGSVPWVLNYGKNGVLVDVTSPTAIEEGLSSLIHNKGLYEQLSQDGLVWVSKKFSSTIIAEAYVRLYETILLDS